MDWSRGKIVAMTHASVLFEGIQIIVLAGKMVSPHQLSSTERNAFVVDDGGGQDWEQGKGPSVESGTIDPLE
jgi:hypothetical protein